MPPLSELEEQVRWTSRLARAILVDHLADCALGQATSVLNADHARHQLEIMLKAQESARKGRVVELTTTFSLPDGGGLSVVEAAAGTLLS